MPLLSRRVQRVRPERHVQELLLRVQTFRFAGEEYVREQLLDGRVLNRLDHVSRMPRPVQRGLPRTVQLPVHQVLILQDNATPNERLIWKVQSKLLQVEQSARRESSEKAVRRLRTILGQSGL